MRFARYVIVVLATLVATMLISVPTAEAATSCNGKECVGLNPSETICANDAKTIAAINVAGDGMLDLRWSKACDAGWARFTTYRRAELSGYAGTGLSHVYVSAWTDQGDEDSAGLGKMNQTFGGTSWWSRMVDFSRPEVCVGVRRYASDRSVGHSQDEKLDLGWTWGPCVD